MKTTSRPSGPVLAFGIVGLAIIFAIGWLGYRRQHPPASPPTESEVFAEATPETNTAAEATAPPPEVVASTFPDGIPPVIPISLVPHLVDAENSHWNKADTYLAMPRGTQNLAGIEFWLEGIIQLQSKSTKAENRTFRESVSIPLFQTNITTAGIEITPLGSNVASVHLLGATRYLGDGEVPVANLVWRYQDGTSQATPILFENQVRDWVRNPYETPQYLPAPFSKAAWHAALPKQAGRFLRLYRFSYANPAPMKVIQELTLVSTMQTPNLFVVGLTLDPLKLGERPDNSANLEPHDAVPVSEINILVQSDDGLPIPDALIRANVQQISGKLPTRYERSAKTDANGIAVIPYPPAADVERLVISATHDDYGGRKMIWDLSVSGVRDVIPATYTFKLGESISLGGTVVDESDQPIADAKFSFYRYWTGSDSPNQVGNQPDFQSRTVSTDVSGHWQLRGLPKELLDSIGFNVKHPDFVDTNLNLRNDSADTAKLRDGTHVFVLKRGLILKGLVLDESDNPIKDARVRVGRAYYSGTQETKTDDKGAFSVRNVVAGIQSFGVLADNFKPVITNLTVKPGMEAIIFRLGAGLKLNGVVKNESGEPLPGVRISVEAEHGGISQDYNFTTTSDNEGRFEWNGSPEEEMKFSFVKTGYESKRRHLLKTGTENIVTMRPSRKVQVWVVDAETESPITKFRAGIGRSYGNFAATDQFYGNGGMKSYADPNGAFIVELDEEEINAIKAEAEDYAPKVEQLPAPENGAVQITLRLKPSPALQGVLVNSQGNPVAGATVAITKDGSFGGSSLQLRKGRLSNYNDSAKVVTTDAEGKFKLGSPPESGGIVIGSAESGFARASVDEVRNTGRLVLQEFGRIEGTIRVSGSPSAGQEVMFSLMNLGVSPDWETARASSDTEGNFKFEKVPPGEGQVVRLIKTSPNSWMHSHQTAVTIEPGKTAHVSFGDEGAVIKGQVRMEVPPGEGEEINFSGSLYTKMPEFNHNFSSPEEAKAFYQSDAWKAQMKQVKNYGVAVSADGSFSLDSIPPGEYTLSVTANKPKAGQDSWNQTPVASGSTTITVPNNASPYAPIGISDIILQPVKK